MKLDNSIDNKNRKTISRHLNQWYGIAPEGKFARKENGNEIFSIFWMKETIIDIL